MHLRFHALWQVVQDLFMRTPGWQHPQVEVRFVAVC